MKTRSTEDNNEPMDPHRSLQARKARLSAAASPMTATPLENSTTLQPPGSPTAPQHSTSSFDSFGLDQYVPLYPDEAKTNHRERASDARVDDALPWELRSAEPSMSCTIFHFLGTWNFWYRVELALRLTFVGVLPAAILINEQYGTGPWISSTFIVSGVLLARGGRETIGQQVQMFGQYLRSAVLWVGVATAATAVQLYSSPVGFAFVYFFGLFFMALLMDGFSRRVAMLLYNIAMVTILRGADRNPSVNTAARICFDWFIGSLFGHAAAVIPWPLFSKKKADGVSELLSRNLSSSLQGLASSFWIDSNLSRNVYMVRVRYLMQRVEDDLKALRLYNEEAAYEFMFESSNRRKLRTMKTQLYTELFRNLNSIRRVIEIVRDRPHILEKSERAILFGERLGKKIEPICVTMEELLNQIGRCTCRKELVQSAQFKQLAARAESLQQAFQSGRREYFYETKMDHLEEFVPLMTFFVFSMDQICVTLMRFQENLRKDIAKGANVSWLRESLSNSWAFLISPLEESWQRTKLLLTRRNSDDLRSVIEAAKVSMAMLASLGFFVLMDSTRAFLSGPTVIAFIMSSNPAEAVNSSAPRLSGTLIGVVCGLFIASLSSTDVQRIAGVCTLVFLTRLVGHVTNIGVAMSYASFIAISQAPLTPLSDQDTIARIQQSTFAVFAYVLITMFIYPCKPAEMLRQSRARAIFGISDTYNSIIGIFTDTARAFEELESAERGTAPFGTSSDERGGGTATFSATYCVAAVNINNHSFSSYLEFPAADFDRVEKQLKAVEKELATGAALMPHAKDQPRMSAAAYPVRACEDTHTALKKVVALLRTMLMSCRMLRERRIPPTKEMICVFRNLTPCANDTAVESRRFSKLLAALVEHRRVDLTSELMKSSHSLSYLCTLLHRRKGIIFLTIIQRLVGELEASGSPNIKGESSAEAAKDDEKDCSEQQYEDLHGSFGYHMESEKKKSVLEGKISLPETFDLPVTVKDAEGMHTLTFSVVLFATEMRKLLVAAEDVLQHRFGK